MNKLVRGILKLQKQLTLCAYIFPDSQKIILLSLGSHESFYSDLIKKYV